MMCHKCCVVRHKFQKFHEIQVGTQSGSWEALPAAPVDLCFPEDLWCPECSGQSVRPACETEEVTVVHLNPFPKRHTVTVHRHAICMNETCSNSMSTFEVDPQFHRYVSMPSQDASIIWFHVDLMVYARAHAYKAKLTTQSMLLALEHWSSQNQLLLRPLEAPAFRTGTLNTRGGLRHSLALTREVQLKLLSMDTSDTRDRNPCPACRGLQGGITIQVDGSRVFPRLKANPSLVEAVVDGIIPRSCIEAELARERELKESSGPTQRCANFTVSEHLREVPAKFRDVYAEWGGCYATCNHLLMLVWADMIGPECFAYYRMLHVWLAKMGVQVRLTAWDNGCTGGKHMHSKGIGFFHPGCVADGVWSCCGRPARDLGSVTAATVQEEWEATGESILGCKRSDVVVPAVHSMNHHLLCQLMHSVLHRIGAGWPSGENVEIANALWRHFEPQSLGWGAHTRHCEIRSNFRLYNFEREERMPEVLCQQFRLNAETLAYNRFQQTRLRHYIEVESDRMIEWSESLRESWASQVESAARAMLQFSKQRSATASRAEAGAWTVPEMFWNRHHVFIALAVEGLNGHSRQQLEHKFESMGAEVAMSMADLGTMDTSFGALVSQPVAALDVLHQFCVVQHTKRALARAQRQKLLFHWAHQEKDVSDGELLSHEAVVSAALVQLESVAGTARGRGWTGSLCAGQTQMSLGEACARASSDAIMGAWGVAIELFPVRHCDEMRELMDDVGCEIRKNNARRAMCAKDQLLDNRKASLRKRLSGLLQDYNKMAPNAGEPCLAAVDIIKSTAPEKSLHVEDGKLTLCAMRRSISWDARVARGMEFREEQIQVMDNYKRNLRDQVGSLRAHVGQMQQDHCNRSVQGGAVKAAYEIDRLECRLDLAEELFKAVIGASYTVPACMEQAGGDEEDAEVDGEHTGDFDPNEEDEL